MAVSVGMGMEGVVSQSEAVLEIRVEEEDLDSLGDCFHR